MSTHFHPLMLSAPAYTIDEDESAGIVRMMVEGFFDQDILARHFDDNAAFVRRWRAAGRPIRVLIDANRLLPHTPQNQAFVMRSFERIYRPGDRVAILVGSSLVKMQMRRTHSFGEIIQFFLSEQGAVTWLKAYDL
ncbi:hypothetical protein [Sphingomonas crocodyli]|uniref:STAS/SEC14 domain-containing protein n=1 Tax=Sphingomonas crocodyli TaxID=1979270 RepID=A0A437LYD2_9SPHN|nr:hypothetical protein [Sphingomonas crocodyli]RVT90343.1 hypothetical protein EOD43_18935 [Sphingomonas crocodyli]